MTQTSGAFNTVSRWSCRTLWLTGLLMALAACADTGPPGIIQYQFQVEAEQSHDPSMFTQGLLKRGSRFYESGGRYGQSRLISYQDNGRQADRERSLAARYFAEGLTELNNELYLLTWREKTLLVYDADTLQPVRQLNYSGEGWGLTDDGEHLIRSDGSARLYFHTPDDFRLTRQVTVTENGKPVTRLNELEYVDGAVWANIWYSDRLIQIDPDNGRVIGSLDLSELVHTAQPATAGAVLNGIAYDTERDQLWVTGKLWPMLYRLSLTPEP